MGTPLDLVLQSRPPTRRRRIRPARFPLAIERTYVARQKNLARQFGAMVDELLLPRLGEIARMGGFRADSERYDQSPWRAVLRSIFGDMRRRWAEAERIAQEQAEQAGAEMSQHNRIEIQRQMRQAVGVDIFFDDSALVDLLEQFTEDNVSRITGRYESIFPDLERIISNGFRTGIRANEISSQIIDKLSVEESKAAFWARDQIGSLNGQLTKQRQESIGVSQYIWRTSRDERVRETHRQLEGTVQSWDDPPTVGKRQVHPGEDYNCRCVPEPVIPGVTAIETGPDDVPRNPELVRQAAERRRRARERRKKSRVTAA